MEIRRAKGHGKYTTFSIELPKIDQKWHIKFRPSTKIDELKREAEIIHWAKDLLPVPQKAYVHHLMGMSALITKTVEGSPSYQHIDTLEPTDIISGISEAINSIQRLEVSEFPFDSPFWATEEGAESNLRRLALSATKRSELHPDFSSRTMRELTDIIRRGSGETTTVVSHGDLCMPNVLLDDKGTNVGIVDLGSLHVGDPHLDLAVMSWTLQANMGDKWANKLLNEHGTKVNDQPIIYNRLIYDIGLGQPNPWSWLQSPQLIDRQERLSK